MDPSQIAAWFGIIASIVGAIAWLSKKFGSPLSKEEIQILSASSKEGRIWILHVDAFGDWVRAGKIDFFKQDDRAYNARYKDAFQKLRNRGYISHQSGILYELTGIGFEIARKQKDSNTA